jgi:hypothetical protein
LQLIDRYGSDDQNPKSRSRLFPLPHASQRSTNHEATTFKKARFKPNLDAKPAPAYTPPVLPWLDGILARVNTSVERQQFLMNATPDAIPNDDRARSPALWRFPPIHLLWSAVDDAKQELMFSMWARVRPICLRRLTSSDDHPAGVSAKIWRVLLSGHYKRTASTSIDDEGQDPVFGRHDFDPDRPAEFFGIHIARSTPISPSLRQVMLWEVAEVSHRFEMRMLDEYIRSVRCAQGHEISGEEEMRRALCMAWVRGPHERLTLDSLAPVPASSPVLAERRGTIGFFAKILEQWPRFPEGLTGINTDTVDEARLAEYERELWAFYSQTFFDYYRRYPTLPRTLEQSAFNSVLASRVVN